MALSCLSVMSNSMNISQGSNTVTGTVAYQYTNTGTNTWTKSSLALTGTLIQDGSNVVISSSTQSYLTNTLNFSGGTGFTMMFRARMMISSFTAAHVYPMLITNINSVSTFNTNGASASNSGINNGMLRFGFRNLSPNTLSCSFLPLSGSGSGGGSNTYSQQLLQNYTSFPNTYNHYAVVVTNSGTTLSATYYQNGSAGSTLQYTLSNGWSEIANLNYVVFNPFTFYLNTQENDTGQCSIYDFRVYNNGLSAQNVLDAYNNVAYVT